MMNLLSVLSLQMFHNLSYLKLVAYMDASDFDKTVKIIANNL